MALALWVLCWRARRGLRNERPTAGNLWRDATLVCTAFSRDSARIFSARQHHWNGQLLAGRIVGPCGDALLSGVASGHAGGDLRGQSDKSSPAWRKLLEIYLSGLDLYRRV